jgi:hypothetical protein
VRGRAIRTWFGLGALFGLWLTVMATGASPALGYYTVGGSGSGPAGVGSLTVPTISSATAAPGGTVSLTWAKTVSPNPVSYYVTRNGGAPGGNCPTAAAPVTEIGTCTDSGLEPGTDTYKVFAKYKTWSATSAAVEAKVTIGPANNLVLAVASTTPTAGVADNLTITAKDKAGSTVTTYTGSHNLVYSGAESSPGGTAPTVTNSSGTAVAFGTATATTFTAGVATVSSGSNGVMKLYKAGATTISVSDGSIESEVDPTVTVAASSLSKLVLTPTTTTPVVGGEDALTVTAADTYGNAVPSYTGSHSLVYSGAESSPGGTAPTVTNSSGTAVAFGTASPTNFSSGVATVSGGSNGVMKLYKAAAANVKVTEGSTTSATVAVTAAAGAATSLKVTAASTTPVAGATDNLTTTALDAYGNAATSYTGEKKITFSGPELSPNLTAATVLNKEGAAVNIGGATALTFTSGVASVASSKNGVFKAAKSGAATLSATDGTISTASALALTVSAGTASKYAWASPTSSTGSTRSSPCLFTCTITTLGNSGTFTAKVAVTDSLGNVVSNLGTANTVGLTTTGGGLSVASLTIATTGLAESTASFTYTAPSSGTYSNTITAKKSSGTEYTGATATASK